MTVKRDKSHTKSLKTEAMSLKRKTVVDEIVEKVVKPEGAVPNFGLPKWKNMSLDRKIPMIAGPKGAYNISRKKMGKKLWVGTKGAEFNLNDPCNYEMEFSYDPLHDEHLARYFSSERNTRKLLKLGYITKDFDAKCSLRDYNMYRKFLKKLESDAINKEWKQQDELAEEKRILTFAESFAQREIKRLKKEERKTLAMKKMRNEGSQMEAKNKEKRQEAAKKATRKLELMELAKNEARRNRILQSQKRSENMRKKREEAIANERMRNMKRMIERAQKEADRRRTRKERLARETTEKLIAVEQKWERRKEEEEREISRKESVLRYTENERRKFIEKYESKMQRRRNNEQKRFEGISRFVQCHVARSVSKRGKGTCCTNKQKPKKI